MYLLVPFLIALLSGCIDDRTDSNMGTLQDPSADVTADRNKDTREITGPEPPLSALLMLLEQRKALGLTEPTQSPILTQAAQNHAEYLFINGITATEGTYLHREDPSRPGFTGTTIQERLTLLGYQGTSLGENVAFRPSTESAVQSWLESLYSRIPLIRAGKVEIGTGSAGEGAQRTVVMVIGRPQGAQPSPLPYTFYPAEQASNIATLWDGNELPQPQPPPAGYPSGPIVSLHIQTGNIVEAEGTLTRLATGEKMGATLLTSQNDESLSPQDVALIPHAPLKAGEAYRVALKAVTDSSTLSKAWEFMTQVAECDPVQQNCGLGRACYVQQGIGKCQWVGETPIKMPCAFMNECSRGTGCYGIDELFACREYCDRDGSQSCDTLCPQSHTTINDTAFGFCW